VHDRGVVGIDIAGPDPPDSGQPTTDRCSSGLATSGGDNGLHVGESGPVEEIAEVIEELEPDRIGHA